MFFDGADVSSTADSVEQTNPYATGKSGIDQFNAIKSAIDAAGLGKEAFKNFSTELITIEGSAMALQRTMGGVVANSEEFRKVLTNAYLDTREIGASFKDVTDVVEGLASSMGRIVNPSSELVQNMVEMSKSTGITGKKIAEMAVEFTRYGGTQKEALANMKKLADEARKVGINTSSYMSAVSTNMKKIGGFGFKNGVDGLKSMVKQASMLRTSMEKIGAAGFAETILDPEGAMKAAAGFQMLGGAVGKLSDPFQLMYLAQNDMAGLQEEMVNATKASFNAGNGFKASNEDLFRLKEMAKLTGANFEDMVESGREAAKLDFIESKMNMSNLTEEQKGLIASLAQIDEGGNVKIDIPGYEEGNKTIQDMIQDNDFKTALDKYQVTQGQTEKEIAQKQMTISEEQARDVNVIKESMLFELERGEGGKSTATQDFLENLKITNKSLATTGKASGEAVAKTSVPMADRFNVEAGNYSSGLTPSDQTINTLMQAQELLLNAVKNADPSVIFGKDMLFSPSSAPTLMSEGAIYKGIVGDEVAFGTGLTDAFNKTGQINQVMSNIISPNNNGGSLNNNSGGGNATVGGKIDININLNGSISGDNGNLEKVFSDPRVQKQIMDTVLYKLKGYTQKQGVLSNNS